MTKKQNGKSAIKRVLDVVLPFKSAERIIVAIVIVAALALCAYFGYSQSQAVKEEYTITFSADGIELDDYAYTFAKGLNLPSPSREGYTFGGWYADPEFTQAFSGDARIKADTTLYGKWIPNEYTLTFQRRGGSGPAQMTAPYDTPITLPVSDKDGYTFLGWADGADSLTPVSYDKMPLGGGTLYALFEETEYTVTYHLDGGENNTANPTAFTISSNSFTLLDPYKATYDFSGWFTDASFTQPITALTKGRTGNLNLYAQWDKTSYTVTFDLCGGGTIEPILQKWGEAIELPRPGRDYYDFMGWFTDASYTQSFEETTMPVGGAVIFAKWQPAEYTITYYLNGGENNALNPSEYTYFTPTFTLLDAQFTDNVFLGWYTDGEFTSEPVSEITQGSSGNIELYAKWQIGIAAVVFEGNGVPSPDSISANIGSTITLPVITKEGYGLAGWFTDNNTFNNEFTSSTPIPGGGVTLYAKWTPVEYSITYHLDGGDGDGLRTSYNIESETFALDDPTKEGYEFDGWFEESGFETEITWIVQGSMGNIEVYAKWTPVEYTITYNLDGGEAQGLPESYNIESDTVTLASPQKEGYDFLCWTDGGVIPAGSTGNKSFTALWEAIEYTITYANVDGATHSNPATYTIESPAITLTGAEKDGYDFLSWDEGSEIPAGSTGNKTFTASWTIITYFITYNNVFDGTHANPADYTVETDTFILSVGERTGYDFDGWFTDSGFDPESEITQVVKGSTGNLALYAKWTPIEYSIEYNLNGGEGEDFPTSYNIETPTFDLPLPTKTGYEFISWFTDIDFDPATEVETIIKGSTGNLALYAKWLPIQYTLTFISNGGSEVAPITQGYQSEVMLPVPDYPGYALVGWFYDDGIFEQQFTSSTMPLGGATLYAAWEIAIYTITYYLDGGENYELNPDTYTMFDGIMGSEVYSAWFAYPIREGYTFDGWYTDPDFSGDPLEYLLVGEYGDIELWAKWVDSLLIYSVILDEDENEIMYILGYAGEGSGNLIIPNKIGGVPVVGIGPKDESFDSFYQKGFEEIYISEGIKSIGSMAFFECAQLTYVRFPSTLEEIGMAAFYSCPNLNNITLPDSVSTLGMGAFGNCSSLSSINIPAGLDRLEDGVFGYTAITGIIVPDHILSIGIHAFEGCAQLVSADLPDSITAIGYKAFYSCPNLTTVILRGPTPPDIVTGGSAAEVFDESETLTLYVPAAAFEDYLNHPFWGTQNLISY